MLLDNFHFEVRIAKLPADVYAALTTKQGIQGWWTPDCDVPSQVILTSALPARRLGA